MAKRLRSVLETMIPMYKIFKIFGIMPLKIVSNNNQYILKKSFPALIYSCFLLFYILFSRFLMERWLTNHSIIEFVDNEIVTLIFKCQYFFNIISACLNIFTNIYNRKNTIKFLENVQKIDDKMSITYNIDIPYEKHYKSAQKFVKYFIAFILFMTISVQLILPLFVQQNKSIGYLERLIKSFYEIKHFINFFSNTQLWALMLLMRSRFELINKAMHNVENRRLSKEEKLLEKKKLGIMTQTKTPIALISNLCKVHYDIHKLSYDISFLCRIQMLTVTINAFITTIARLYICVLLLYTSKRWGENILFIAVSLFWIIGTNFMILLVIEEATCLRRTVRFIIKINHYMLYLIIRC